MKEFTLLKRTYPVSIYDRNCDGYKYIMENSTKEERIEMGINESELQKTIGMGEKYIYEVAKEGNELRILSASYTNFKIIRKHFFGLQDN